VRPCRTPGPGVSHATLSRILHLSEARSGTRRWRRSGARRWRRCGRRLPPRRSTNDRSIDRPTARRTHTQTDSHAWTHSDASSLGSGEAAQVHRLGAGATTSFRRGRVLRHGRAGANAFELPGPQPLRRCLFGGETLQLERRSLDACVFSTRNSICQSPTLALGLGLRLRLAPTLTLTLNNERGVHPRAPAGSTTPPRRASAYASGAWGLPTQSASQRLP